VVERAVEIEIKHLSAVTLLIRLRGNTETQRLALERRRQFDGWTADLIRRAQREGGVRKDIDPVVAARLVLGTLNSLTEWYRPDGTLGWREIADAVVGTLFDGLS
jgi:hypothetical protein